MATRERDYYEVLGIPRDAGDADIKRAFRKLARELHPDVSSAPEADKDFREVAEAFEVLSDPERRATYDRFGHAGLRRGGFQPTFTDFGNIADVFAAFFGEDLFGAGVRDRGPARGGDIQVALEIELEDAFTGVDGARIRRRRGAVRDLRRSGLGARDGNVVLQHVRRKRGAPTDLAERLRRVRQPTGLPAVRRTRPRARGSLPEL